LPALSGQGSLEPPPGTPAPTQKSLQEIWDHVANLEGTIDGLQTDIDGLQDTVADLESTNAALLDQLARLESGEERNRFALAVMFQDQLPWEFTLVDGANAVGETVSVAFGPNGLPAVAYIGAGRLRIAQFDGTAWTSSVVDATNAFSELQPSLAFAPDGHPAIAYHNATLGTLSYAIFDGADWTITNVDENPTTGQFPSLAFGPDGFPAIAYYYFNDSDLRFAKFDGDKWIIELVDTESSTGRFPSLAISSDGLEGIVYLYDGADDFDLRMASRNGSNWNVTTLESNGLTGLHSSLALDSNDSPWIVFRRSSAEELVVAHHTGPTLGFDVLDAADDPGSHISSIAFGADGRPFVAYYVNDTRSLRLARYDGAAWIIQNVADFGDVGFPSDLAIGPDGMPLIAFVEITTGGNKLWVARRHVPVSSP